MAALLALPNLPATSLGLLIGSPAAVCELILFAGNDQTHPIQPMIQIALGDIMRWLAIVLTIPKEWLTSLDILDDLLHDLVTFFLYMIG